MKNMWWRITESSSLRRLLALLCLIVSSVTSMGCFYVPIAYGDPPAFPDESVVQSLVGSTKAEVLDILPRPTSRIEDEKGTYFLYEGYGQGGGVFLVLLIPVPTVGDDAARVKHCLRLEFDDAERLKSFQKKTYAGAFSNQEALPGCVRSFWSSKEVAKMEEMARQQQEAEGIEGLRVQAEKGDAAAQYVIYLSLEGRRTKPVQAWKWLCKAANQGHASAQWQVGYSQTSSLWDYWTSREAPGIKWLREAGIGPDDQVAYMWFTLSAANGNPDAIHNLQQLANGMTADQIAGAKQMARDWKPGNCPSAENQFDGRSSWYYLNCEDRLLASRALRNGWFL